MLELQNKKNIDVLKQDFFPILNFDFLIIKEYSDLFKKYLPKNQHFKSLEVGCDLGLWMWYFNKFLSYKVSAIDILDSSLKSTDKTLKHYNTPYHELICKDILKYEKKSYYDFVYSIGTIEHFENPSDVFRKSDSLLKKGGYIMIEVPHFSRVNMFIMKLFMEKKRYDSYLEIHNLNILSLNKFKSFIKQNIGNSYEILYLDTAGVFDMSVYNILAFWKPNIYPKIERKIFAMRKLLRFLNIKSISPGLMFIGRKK